MRFLRNPIVTGVLSLLAVGMVFQRLVFPYLRSGGVAIPVVSVANPAADRAFATAKVLREQLSEAAAPWRGPTIDRDYIEGRFAKWVATPVRDPFLLLGIDPKEKEMQDLLEPSPVSKWKL